MSEYKSFQTPLKEEQENVVLPQTADLTPDQYYLARETKVDYRAKTFKLMKQLAEAEVLNKKYQTQLRHFEKQNQAFQNEFQKFFKALGVHNLEEAFKKVQFILQSDKKMGNEQKVNEWANLIEEYKKIINAQQYKYIKLEQQFKISEVKLKRYEQDKFQSIKEKGEETNKSMHDELKVLKQEKVQNLKNLQSLEEEVAILKKQYKQEIVERDNLKDMFEELQSKYNLEIQHFQEMEKHVEQRLIEVERQMNYYRQQREEHLEKIDLMKKQIDYRQSEAYFSFGGTKNVEIQTEEDDAMPQFNNQCLEISIKTLLEENERLKNTLITLYSKKSDEELPKEIQLQLKILLNMKQNLQKHEKREFKSQSQQNFKLNIMEISSQTNRQSSVPETIEEQDDESEQKVREESEID